jgi:Tfp pilus assembly protein FimT
MVIPREAKLAKRSGLSLTEVLLLVAVIGIIPAIAFP